MTREEISAYQILLTLVKQYQRYKAFINVYMAAAGKLYPSYFQDLKSQARQIIIFLKGILAKCGDLIKDHH